MSEYVFHNGVILTQDPQHPRVEALLTRNGGIAAAGSRAAVQFQAGPNAQFVDLAGKTLLPAFTDAHIHLWKVGDLLCFMLDLRGVDSRAEMREKLREFAGRNPQNAWVLARGFNEALFSDGQIPTRLDLDKAVPDRPAYVIRTCAHIAVLNTKALEICGITAQTPVPAGGEIRTDAHGQPNGILSETALGLAVRHIPKYSAEAYKTMILTAQEAFLSRGIACATDPAVHPELLEVYRQMERAGELKVRINAVPIRVPDGDANALPLPELYESDFLKIDTVKFFADGGLSGKTAALHQPYKNSDEKGVLRLDYAFFKRCAMEAQEAGLRVATHAIGDRAIDLVLKVYEDLDRRNKKGLRHRIEHLGLPDARHLTRMYNLGLHCVTQPVFLYELGPNFRQYLPDSYLERVYPYRSVLESGVNLAFSSDAPVVKDFNPLTGIRSAVERCDHTGVIIGASERISAEAALRAYTLGAADANGDADKTGSLSAGKRADFVVLDKNPLEFDAPLIPEIKVVETWIGGKRPG
jgi:predicted amidohydrolase YtcJ